MHVRKSTEVPNVLIRYKDTKIKINRENLQQNSYKTYLKAPKKAFFYPRGFYVQVARGLG